MAFCHKISSVYTNDRTPYDRIIQNKDKKEVKEIFKNVGKNKPIWHKYNFKGLLDKVLQDIEINKSIFYFAKIKEHPDTKEKSQKLILQRRLLKVHLENQGFKVILSGAVRGNYRKDGRGKDVLVFKEKGVDISIAVDMVVAACDKMLKTAIVGSSDSDLQPAIDAGADEYLTKPFDDEYFAKRVKILTERIKEDDIPPQGKLLQFGGGFHYVRRKNI